MAITNPQLKDFKFLAEMYSDDYFPNHLVDKGRDILVRLCERIEAEQPKDADAVYALTHAATEEFNDLDEEFHENESEIETMAREVIADDFGTIVEAYGFGDLDLEEVIATRDW